MRRQSGLDQARRGSSLTPYQKLEQTLTNLRLGTPPHDTPRTQGASLLTSRPRTLEQNSHKLKPPLCINKLVAPRTTRPATSRPLKDHNINITPEARSIKRSSTIDFDKPNGTNSVGLVNYTLGKVLGQGAYAIVKLAVHKQSKLNMAVKTYDKATLLDPRKRRNVKREIEILEKLNHPNIIKLIETVDSPRQLHLVMECAGGSSLHRYLKRRPTRRLEEHEAKRIFKQITAAISYCHDLNISHRDIKLENILLDEANDVKVIDFGFSTCMPSDNRMKLFCGTPSYMAPEIVLRKEYTGNPADIWALGILLYALLSGSFPFKGTTERELYRKIARGVFEFPSHIIGAPRNLIKKMLTVDPDRRPSSSQVLSDGWFSSSQETTSRPPTVPRLEGSKYNTDVISRIVKIT